MEGNPSEWHRQSSQRKNHFFAFFRAEGVSENTGGRGKWGVGKTVFPRSSRVNAHFGLTIRRSDYSRLLMGQTVLRYHTLAGRPFASDGMFGTLGADDLVLPVDTVGVHEDFSRDFRLRRGDEPGLSVVVPYCHEEITAEAIVRAVAREYFYPILTGKLSVIVESGDGAPTAVSLDANTLLDSVDSEGDELDEDLRSVVDLAVWAHTLLDPEIARLNPPAPDPSPAWSRALFPDSVLRESVERFVRGDRLALRVPLAVHTAAGETLPSFFDVFLQQDLSGRGYPPVFIRNGIIIPKALERRVRGHHLRALVIIDDKALGTLLGDAETPAHTQWSHRTQNFMDKYLNGPAHLDFVRSAPRQVAEILSGARQQRDRLALADFFPRPPEEDGLESARARERRKRGEAPEPPPAPPPAALRALAVDQIDGGFSIRRADREAPLPSRIEVSVAYDRARGNPLAKYHPADFTLDAMGRRFSGAAEVDCGRNRIVVDLLRDDFRIEVSGFDPNRDVFVRIRKMEPAHD